jgi:hypothetical protein
VLPLFWRHLATLDMSNNRLNGSLPLADLDFLVSWYLSFVSFAGNSALRSDTRAIPRVVAQDRIETESFTGNFRCPRTNFVGGANLLLPPQYFDYRGCECLSGYWYDKIHIIKKKHY